MQYESTGKHKKSNYLLTRFVEYVLGLSREILGGGGRTETGWENEGIFNSTKTRHTEQYSKQQNMDFTLLILGYY